MTKADIGIVEKLKACPFCGNDEPVIELEKVSALSRLCAVFCNACEISGEKMSTAEAAIAAWNTRDPIITEMVEALERDRKALEAMMNTWLDYHDSHSLTEPVTGASNNAFEDALAARDAIDTLLAKVSGK